MDTLYKLTNKGRQLASSVLPSRRDPVLDYLYKLPNRSATDEEITVAVGCQRSEMMRYERKGLVTKEM